MVEQIKSDLTSGKISTHFRNLAVPMAIGMVFYTLYNMVGIFFAGKLSTSAQASIGIGHLVFFFLMAFGFGVNAAMAGLVGNARGRGDTENAKEIVENGVDMSVIVTDMNKPEQITRIQRKPSEQNGHPLKIVTGKKNCAILRIESSSAKNLLESLEQEKRYSEFVVLSPFTKDGIEFTRILFLDGDYVNRNEKYVLSFD